MPADAARHHADGNLHQRNGRHIADQAVTLPTKTSIPVCTFDDVFNRRFNDGQHPAGKRLPRFAPPS